MRKDSVIADDSPGFWNFIYPEDVKTVVVSGDIHGGFREIVNKTAVQYGIRDALIVIAGDCGFGFERQGYYETVYQRCAKHLKKNNLYMAFVRGNHDNPFYFNGRICDKSRWMTLPDYSVVHAAGRNILCIGGAVSVDRQFRFSVKPMSNALHYHGDERLKPANWWPDERIIYDEEKLDIISSKENRIDTVITHTAPSFCEMIDNSNIQKLAENDETLLDDVAEERKRADMIHSKLKESGQPVRDWVYGHFHSSWQQSIEDIMFTMLDCEQLKQLY